MISIRRIALLAGLLPFGLTPVRTSFAQQVDVSPTEFASLEDLHAHYDRQLADLERRRLVDLIALSKREAGPDADAVRRELFQLAIALDELSAAGRVADGVLSEKIAAPDVRNLATLVTWLSMAERGQADGVLAGLHALLETANGAGGAKDETGTAIVLGVAEAFVQRLIHSGRYALATKVCSLITAEAGDPNVAAHFRTRLRTLALVGKPAPALSGTDADGKPLDLASLRGNVVLITFWAGWCPPCLSAFPRLNHLEAKHRDRGFAVVGVNLDAHHEDVKDVKAALPLVRHILIEYGVTWPNVLNDEGARGDIARAYGVETVPTNVLIGRDGLVLGIELADPLLEPSIQKALGEGAR